MFLPRKPPESPLQLPLLEERQCQSAIQGSLRGRLRGLLAVERELLEAECGLLVPSVVRGQLDVEVCELAVELQAGAGEHLALVDVCLAGGDVSLESPHFAPVLHDYNPMSSRHDTIVMENALTQRQQEVKNLLFKKKPQEQHRPVQDTVRKERPQAPAPQVDQQIEAFMKDMTGEFKKMNDGTPR